MHLIAITSSRSDIEVGFSFDRFTHFYVTVFWLNVEFVIFGEIHFTADLSAKLVQNFLPPRKIL